MESETRCQTDPARFANNFYYKTTTHILNQIPASKLSPFGWLPASEKLDPILGLQHVEEYFVERP